MSIDELVAAVQAGDESKMGELWDKISGLVKWKASRTMTALETQEVRRVEFDDLYQIGYFALLSALETYTPGNGSFSSWLMYYLRTAFAEAAGYRTKQGRIENAAISLDDPLDDEENKSRRVDFVADITAFNAMLGIEEREYQKQLHEALEAALTELSDKQSQVLRLRYFQNQTLGEAGANMGISTERVRQIERNGLRMLRQPKTAAQLISFFEFDYYTGTGLSSFLNSGMSIQEKYLVLQEKKQQRKEQRERSERERKHADTLRRMKENAWHDLQVSLDR